MSPALTLERLRDYADGVLAAPQARELERALGQEAPEACEAATYLLVHRLSAPLLAPTAPSRLVFEDLALTDAPPRGPAWLTSRPRRWALAAAALLLLAVGAWWHVRSHDAASGPAEVRLTSVPWTSAVPVPDARLVADYRPTAEKHVVWLEDAEAATALARASGRPVLRFVQHPECPMCRALEAGPLRDDEVLRALDGVVPLRLDVERLPRAEGMALMREGWPHLSVRGAEGRVLGTFAGMRTARDLALRIASALATTAAAAPASWTDLSAQAKAQARRREAQTALHEVHDLAARDPEAARRRLEAARALLGATPEGDDLGRVLAAWRPPAPFPRIEEPPPLESPR